MNNHPFVSLDEVCHIKKTSEKVAMTVVLNNGLMLMVSQTQAQALQYGVVSNKYNNNQLHIPDVNYMLVYINH